MNTQEADKTNKRLWDRVKSIFKRPSTNPLKSKSKTPQKKNESILREPQSLAYQLIGGKTGQILPFFKGLDLTLNKSGLKVNFKAYVSLTVFTALLASSIALFSIPGVLIAAFSVPPFPAVLFGIGGAMFAGAFSVIGFYFYPIYRADKLKRDLEDEMPFTTGYMAILASAGVSPERIFQSLSNLSAPLAVSKESRDIVRDVNLFGLDILSALEKASERNPSAKFGEMLEGFISTVHSGGNLAAYLREKSTQHMKLKRISLRKFSDTLSTLSEFYVALLITGPLLLVIMLAVMAMLGGGNLGILSPDLILNILTYVGIPIGTVMFLIILDAVSPKW